ncbi:phosphotransferase system phosphocarrier protein HPr [Gottschalkia purinilytica]|uniref:Phosphocarrier protein HPr n=1 Tax=Gottschalkia purinilytica TaxID=1503 RepID=A0A0L0WCE8_GOTPU|nr:HPr family phosphocarrier protein [Gottschalkia purinilytica]KNF09141.1 phosphotransferase system phosphocarrier protein HPr [Gottschalkia purinilytica]
MVEKTITINNELGLHARPAALFVQACGKYKSDIYIEKGDNKVNAKSIMGIMALGVYQGEEIKIIASGYDEEDALKGITEFLENLK